jgi:signal transduction histidine kinase
MFLLIGLALGWLTLALGGVLCVYLRRRWQTRQYGPPVDHSVLLVEYGRKMMGVLDRQALSELLTVELPQVFQVDRAALLLPEDHQLVALVAGDSGAEGSLHLPVSHAAVRWVASAGEAQRGDGGRLRELISQGRADLAWAVVWVPLMHGANLRGLWLMGVRTVRRPSEWDQNGAPPIRMGPEWHRKTAGREDDGSGERTRGPRPRALLYAPEDLRCLTAIGRQAAVMLEAARHAERERQSANELRALYQQVVAAREAERGRLSRELHDGVLQDLCAVTRDLKALEAQVQANGALSPLDGAPHADPSAPHADRSRSSVGLRASLAARSGETVNALRAICNGLRPPLLQQDLVSALQALVQELDARSAAPIHIEVSAEGLSLPEDAAVAIFRIVQEALHNAMQHADASEIAVRLTQYPDRLRLTVTDDGRGIAGGIEPARFVARGHLGLAGMRERAAMIGARLDVQTAVDYGTVVILELSR